MSQPAPSTGPTSGKEAMLRLLFEEADGLLKRIESVAKAIADAENKAPIQLEELAKSQAKATAAVASMAASSATKAVGQKLEIRLRRIEIAQTMLLILQVGVIALLAVQYL